MKDFFRPNRQPARRIYDAFQDEAKCRHKYSGTDWDESEIIRVWKEAKDYAQENGIPEATIEEVRKARTYAFGHVDYGAKWAYEITRIILSKQNNALMK